MTIVVMLRVMETTMMLFNMKKVTVMLCYGGRQWLAERVFEASSVRGYCSSSPARVNTALTSVSRQHVALMCNFVVLLATKIRRGFCCTAFWWAVACGLAHVRNLSTIPVLLRLRSVPVRSFVRSPETFMFMDWLSRKCKSVSSTQSPSTPVPKPSLAQESLKPSYLFETPGT